MKKKFEADIVCQSCGGTGLYRGMAEYEGCAVICIDCNGTGKDHYVFEYESFKKRKERKDVKRVFKNSCGYGHRAEDFRNEEDEIIEYSKGGCTYEEWLKGIQPKPEIGR